jgi:hypothetical protein
MIKVLKYCICYTAIRACWIGLENVFGEVVYTSNADTIIAIILTYLIVEYLFD